MKVFSALIYVPDEVTEDELVEALFDQRTHNDHPILIKELEEIDE